MCSRSPFLMAVSILLLASCKPAQTAPIVPDATPDGSCEVDTMITQDRMIRAPSGYPLVLPCDGGTIP